MSKQTILVVEDEEPIREMLCLALERAEFEVLQAENMAQAQSIMLKITPTLILLDWMLPGTSGLEFARRLKQEPLSKMIPIIMLTARSGENDKVRGLDVGADDYVTKPFSPRELIARIKAVLRRSPSEAQLEQLTADGLCLYPTEHRVTVDDHDVHLGPTEFRLLHFFMSHPERVYSRGQVLDQVWGINVYIEERTVDVHIRRLRKVLAECGYDHLIQTVRGVGYRFSQRSIT